MAHILKPPSPLSFDASSPTIFLAGSIEMGQATDWQSQVEQAFQNTNATILNPRRDEWDASWRQSIDNPQFREQVEWELEALERADVVAMYFDPATKAPITLLELGLCARRGKVFVFCPEGFWRKGNVEIVCARFGIRLLANLNDLISAVRSAIGDVD